MSRDCGLSGLYSVPAPTAAITSSLRSGATWRTQTSVGRSVASLVSMYSERVATSLRASIRCITPAGIQTAL